MTEESARDSILGFGLMMTVPARITSVVFISIVLYLIVPQHLNAVLNLETLKDQQTFVPFA